MDTQPSPSKIMILGYGLWVVSFIIFLLIFIIILSGKPLSEHLLAAFLYTCPVFLLTNLYLFVKSFSNNIGFTGKFTAIAGYGYLTTVELFTGLYLIESVNRSLGSGRGIFTIMFAGGAFTLTTVTLIVFSLGYLIYLPFKK